MRPQLHRRRPRPLDLLRAARPLLLVILDHEPLPQPGQEPAELGVLPLHRLRQLRHPPPVDRDHRGNRVDRGQQLVGLLLRHVQHERRDLLGVVELALPQVPVDHLQATILQLPCQHSAGEAHLGQDAPQRVALQLAVVHGVPGVRFQLAGGHAAEGFNPIADFHRNGSRGGIFTKTRQNRLRMQEGERGVGGGSTDFPETREKSEAGRPPDGSVW